MNPLDELAAYLTPIDRGTDDYRSALAIIDARARGHEPAAADVARFNGPPDIVRAITAQLRLPTGKAAELSYAFAALAALARGDEAPDHVPSRTPAPESSDEPVPDEEPGPCNSCEPPEHTSRRALAVCSTPGCGCRVPRGKCAGCRRAHDRRRNRTAHRRAYQSPEWKRTRRDFLRAHPYCECDDCLELPELLRPRASVVDHLDGLGPLGPRGHDWSNLRAMFKPHHDARTMRDQVRDIDNGS